MSGQHRSIDSARSDPERAVTASAALDHARLRRIAHDDPAMFIGPFGPPAQSAPASPSTPPAPPHQPLLGVPFAIKDNIDVAGFETTAGCPDYAYWPERSAPAVQGLLDAGAVAIGKTNLDQFATGLVGTRSPYGTTRNVLDPALVPGGSSSGSATAVAAGIVSFALGTDTAGSGRVPAAMNQIVGLKPTRGLVSIRGVVPACASLDCVSVFASTVADAVEVFNQMIGPDPQDPWHRPDRSLLPIVRTDRARVGILGPDQLVDVDPTIAQSYQRSLQGLVDAGAELVKIDFEHFAEAGMLLYQGPFVAERYASVGGFIADSPSSVLEVTRSIIAGGAAWSASDYHEAATRVRVLRTQIAPMWRELDAVAFPSVPLAPTLAAVAADPVGVNTKLGRYTTFTNLLDLAAITVPDPTAPLPGGGMTLHGPALSDLRLASLAQSIAGGVRSKITGTSTEIVVVGAHLEGQPLNHQLKDLGATFVAATTTAPAYKLWALADGLRPALERTNDGGQSISVEVWSLPTSAVGQFVRGVTPPLALGTVTLADGRPVLGFVCELGGTSGATDITGWSGWVNWLSR